MKMHDMILSSFSLKTYHEPSIKIGEKLIADVGQILQFFGQIFQFWPRSKFF
jgi:hypothetical protein